MDLIQAISTFQSSAQEFANSYCIVNGTIMKLQEIQDMGYNEFSYRSKINMPLKLFKYFPNITSKDYNSGTEINYSLIALKNNTVFMQTPTEFDDVYDSDINLSWDDYEHFELIKYCGKCGIKIDLQMSTHEIGNLFLKYLYEFYIKNKSFNGIFSKNPESQTEHLANQLFCKKITNEILKRNDFGAALHNILTAEYKEYLIDLKTKFRVSCFATTPYSQLMWGGAYADCHRGFCLEYTILPNDKNYSDIYYNLFPMIYCKSRPNMTEKLVKAKDIGMTKESLWDIHFNGVLRKSIDWAFQNEWRLLLPPGFPVNGENMSGYNVKFFPITKVYLGNRMKTETRKEIISICHERGIPYIGVQRSDSIFEMKDCNILCENCIHYK